MTGDEALAIFNQYREEINDEFDVVPLEVELPYLVRALGLTGVLLADATANRAGTFKVRGALVAAHAMKGRDVMDIIAASAGNHARGVAVAADVLGRRARLVVPVNAPPAKSSEICALAKSVLIEVTKHGANFDQAQAYADGLVADGRGTLLPAFDHPDVIRGQGTVVDDILAANPNIRNIVLPVGGGGLLAGVVQRLAELDRTDVTVYGAIAEGSDSLPRSLAAGEIVEATNPNYRYGGSAVRRCGQHVLDIVRRYPSQVRFVNVPDTAVSGVMGDYIQSHVDRMLDPTTCPQLEPTNLVPMAALCELERLRGHTAVIGTGRNAPLTFDPPRQHRRIHV